MTRLFTIGHSTRSLEQFLDCLRSFGVRTLVDVRRSPSSRRSPHFNTVPLKKGLFHAGVGYLYLGDELGGQRKERPDSPHVGLARSGLQGYADWMEGEMFARGAARLAETASRSTCATMCAERPPAGCHRSLVSDHMALVHGLEVRDILDPGLDREHFMTPGVRRMERGLLYDLRASSARLDSFGSVGP